MVRKTLGYVELEWKCPKCGTMNPGPQKFCSGCGAQQPKKVEFQQQAEEKLITDEAEIARAKAGPDVHCAFCGARNPATAERCTQCGASLESATARESGQVLGAYRDKPAAPVKCPQCGTENPATASRCSACNASLKRPARPKPKPRTAAKAPRKPAGKVSPLLAVFVILVGVFLCVGCVLATLSMISREQVTGTVSSVQWERSIEIEELGDVSRSGWKDDIPSDADLGSCRKKMHHTQDNPAPGAKEVCGTPYTIDKGTGHGEVVQDCKYQVYQDWCNYTVKEWKKVDTRKRSGADYNPLWPRLNLGAGQRERDRAESYKVFFTTEKKDYVYTTSSEDKFQQCQIGSRWKLKINMLGHVKSIEPVH